MQKESTAHPLCPVGDILMRMVGVWHDQIHIYSLEGDPLREDAASGTPGAAPFDNLVYIDFDGKTYLQTNVTFRGRPLHVRSFSGIVQDGLLRFNELGPQDPKHVGIAAGGDRLIFSGVEVTDSWKNYIEPDFIVLTSPATRTRTTLLYRHGKAQRTLVAHGHKLSPDATSRLNIDPRGPNGQVHEPRKPTAVFSQ